MKNFVKGLITNRLGIVLAGLNLCYFAHDSLKGINQPLTNFDKIMLGQNSPALLLTIIPLAAVKSLFSMTMFEFLWGQFGFITFLFFVTLQWLFIGWTAKKIAQKIRE